VHGREEASRTINSKAEPLDGVKVTSGVDAPRIHPRADDTELESGEERDAQVVRRAGRDLGVRYVLEGSVRRAGALHDQQRVPCR
jgi:hypothetical protein